MVFKYGCFPPTFAQRKAADERHAKAIADIVAAVKEDEWRCQKLDGRMDCCLAANHEGPCFYRSRFNIDAAESEWLRAKQDAAVRAQAIAEAAALINSYQLEIHAPTGKKTTCDLKALADEVLALVKK